LPITARYTLSFEPSDIVSRLNEFRAPTPIEVPERAEPRDGRLTPVDGERNWARGADAARLGFEQELRYPTVKVNVYREPRAFLG